MNKVFLWDMTSDEAEIAIKEADFIVLPTGSIEQHSIHLPVSTDSIRAEELTKYIVLNSGDIKMVMLPTLVYGESLHHMRCGGTISLRNDTYSKVIEDIAWSVKQRGGKRLLIVNYHGGNLDTINFVRGKIERELELKIYLVQWSSFASDLVKEWFPGVPYGHSGFYETSMIMHFRPDFVQNEKLRKQEQRYKRKSIKRALTRGTEAAYFTDQYITGGIGDPTLAKAELAEKIIPKVTQRIIEALKEDMKYE